MEQELPDTLVATIVATVVGAMETAVVVVAGWKSNETKVLHCFHATNSHFWLLFVTPLNIQPVHGWPFQRVVERLRRSKAR